jgi:hypothetical protein
VIAGGDAAAPVAVDLAACVKTRMNISSGVNFQSLRKIFTDVPRNVLKVHAVGHREGRAQDSNAQTRVPSPWQS